MRTFALLLLALAACSGDSSSTQPPAAPVSTPLGPVTFRFQNQGTANVYVDLTFGAALAVHSDAHPEPYALKTNCTFACPDACTSCVQCGAPQPRVKVITPGSYFDTTWNGTWYTFQSCTGSFCQCYDAHVVSPGTFHVSLAGALGVTGGTPDPQDATILQNAELDTGSGTCTAQQSFDLTTAAATVDIVFTCAAP